MPTKPSDYHILRAMNVAGVKDGPKTIKCFKNTRTERVLEPSCQFMLFCLFVFSFMRNVTLGKDEFNGIKYVVNVKTNLSSWSSASYRSGRNRDRSCSIRWCPAAAARCKAVFPELSVHCSSPESESLSARRIQQPRQPFCKQTYDQEPVNTHYGS